MYSTGWTITQPTVFKFKVLSSHKDPLSRQIREAVTIREQGNLNKRNEYSLNELIKLECTSYAWEEARKEKTRKREEASWDNKFDSFSDRQTVLSLTSTPVQVELCLTFSPFWMLHKYSSSAFICPGFL